MSQEELQVHVRKLNEHAAIIRAKMIRQQHAPQPPSPRKAKAARRQLSRLEALASYGQELIETRSGNGNR